jgi:hypothetical protein
MARELRTTMTKSEREIDAALSSEGPISREIVLSWIESTADSDLPTLSKLYRLTDDGYHRIQPELGGRATGALIHRYLLGCIRDNVTGNEEIASRYEATQELHVWFRHMLGMEGSSAILENAAAGITKLYLESGDEVRDSIEMGFLEHALETAALRPYFEHWASDTRLNEAWKRALEWGEAHPDSMEKMFKRLQRSGEE